MAVGGEGIVKAALPHQNKADGVAERVTLVKPSLQKPDGFLLQLRGERGGR